MKKHRLHIGTSGWSYKHWQGAFYPESLKASEQFDYYQKFFTTVEINNSFYHLPEKETFDNWRRHTPEDFVFSVKASRYITHNKKLNDPEETLPLFMEHVKCLKKKLGPVLFQLAPNWNLNIERLAAFLKALPPKHRYVFEFRNQSWYTEEVYQLLKKYNCAFCIYELAGHQSPYELTADFVYIRLHGPGSKYQGSYSAAALKNWKKRCEEWLKTGDVFIYFDNDEKGYAAHNAIALQKISE